MLDGAWDLAQHLAELTGAHALYSAGKDGAKKGASAAVAWLRGHLSPAAHGKIDAVERQPGPGPAKAALELAIYEELQTRPELLDAARKLLAEAAKPGAITQTVGDHSRAGLNVGSGNTITISG